MPLSETKSGWAPVNWGSLGASPTVQAAEALPHIKQALLNLTWHSVTSPAPN